MSLILVGPPADRRFFGTIMTFAGTIRSRQVQPPGSESIRYISIGIRISPLYGGNQPPLQHAGVGGIWLKHLFRTVLRVQRETSQLPWMQYMWNIYSANAPTRWWPLRYFLSSLPTWGDDSIWRSYFSDGLKPPELDPHFCTNIPNKHVYCNPIPYHLHDYVQCSVKMRIGRLIRCSGLWHQAEWISWLISPFWSGQTPEDFVRTGSNDYLAPLVFSQHKVSAMIKYPTTRVDM